MRFMTSFFGLGVLALLLLLAWLDYRLLAAWFPWYRNKRFRYGYWLLTIGTCLMIGFFWSSRPVLEGNPDALRALAYASFAWLIGIIVMALLLPVVYLAHRALPGRSPAPSGGEGISRRAFLRHALATAPVLAVGVAGQGVYEAETAMAVNRYDLAFGDLPESLAGLKIVQLSDLHLGPYFTLQRLDSVLALVRKEQPDLLVITGDFADDLTLLPPAVGRMEGLIRQIPYGAYFCWGNHEYFRDISKVHQILTASPIKILDNTSAQITPDRQLYLLGVDYPWPRDQREAAATRSRYLAAALRDVPTGAFSVLLAHHPDFFMESFAAGIPLTLSGHTHGGQIVIMGQTVLPLRYRYMRGFYRAGKSVGYVHSGTGHWFPFRLGCPPEIGVFRLARSADSPV